MRSAPTTLGLRERSIKRWPFPAIQIRIFAAISSFGNPRHQIMRHELPAKDCSVPLDFANAGHDSSFVSFTAIISTGLLPNCNTFLARRRVVFKRRLLRADKCRGTLDFLEIGH